MLSLRHAARQGDTQMNRLKGYVRRTIQAAAKEGAAYYRDVAEMSPKGAKLQALDDACVDASRGTDTGWWHDLIYTQDVLRLATRYRRDIARTVGAYLNETGADSSQPNGRRGDQPSLNAVVLACAGALGPNASDAAVDALCFGLRFAIEWLTQEVAAELGVVL